MSADPAVWLRAADEAEQRAIILTSELEFAAYQVLRNAFVPDPPITTAGQPPLAMSMVLTTDLQMLEDALLADSVAGAERERTEG